MSEMIPEGWIKASLSEVVAVNPKHTDLADQVAGFVPMALAPTDFNGTLNYEERQWNNIKKGYTHFATGDIIFAKVTPCFENGKAAIVKDMPNGIGAGSTEFYVLRPLLDSISSDYIFSVIKSYEFLQTGAENMTGAVGLRRVPKKFVEDFKINLPPLAEQKVIADKLDELLAQVESTKARLDAIPTILKSFRQSVLTAAVSGKLTEEWRQNNTSFVASLPEIQAYWAKHYQILGKRFKNADVSPIQDIPMEIPDNWIWSQIGLVFDVYVGATPSRKEERYWGGDINWVSSSEVAFCRISETKETITNEGLNCTSTNVHPKGTVMLAMIGQGKTRGQPAILDIDACHNQNTAAIRIPEKYCISEYLYYFLYERYEETRRVGSGNNQQAMNKSVVQSLSFPLPPYEEQVQIVRRVEELFAFADKVEAQVNAAQTRVNNLTQSILAKAFRGELTADWRAANPELISGENSAEALLEKIKFERQFMLGKKTRKKA